MLFCVEFFFEIMSPKSLFKSGTDLILLVFATHLVLLLLSETTFSENLNSPLVHLFKIVSGFGMAGLFFK